LRRVELSRRDEKRRAKREVKEVVEGERWNTEVRSGKGKSLDGRQNGGLGSGQKGRKKG